MGGGSCYLFFYENSQEDEAVGRQSSRHAREDGDVLKPFRGWFEGLPDRDQICWAYGIRPSEYNRLISKEIWYDVTYQLRVRLGETTISYLQQHYSMVKILSQAFGSDDKSSDKESILVNDLPPETAAQTLNNFFKI